MQESYRQFLASAHEFFQYIISFSHLYRLGGSIIIFVICLLFKNLFTQYIFDFFLNWNKKKDNTANEYFLTAFYRPIKLLIVLFGAYLAVRNYLPAGYGSLINKIFSSGIIFIIAGAINNVVEMYAANEQEINRLFNREVDKILIPFFSKMIRFVVLALAFVAIASDWGYDVNGFIAGLGLGGLAFALAAKDLLANIFSGIVIITDKPFSIGDWVKTGDVEGTVVDINFRSTKLRLFDHALVTVPNSNIVNASVVNYTKRSLRRITFHLRLPYSTSSDQLKRCITKIEALLYAHERIDNNMIFVKLDSIEDRGYQLFLYFFTTTIVWKEYLDIKQDINFKIMEILEQEQITIAFPGTSVYLETPVSFADHEQPPKR